MVAPAHTVEWNVHACYTISNVFQFRKEYFGGILYNQKNRGYLSVNRLGADVLELFEKPILYSHAIELLSYRYNTSNDKIDEKIRFFFGKCVSKNILVPAKKTKQSKVEHEYSDFPESGDRFSAPLYVIFNPTFKCNLKCKFCYLSESNENSSEMSLSDAQKIVDILHSKKVFEIKVVGGEPLLVQWLPEFINYAWKKNVKINISTNGTVLDAIDNLPVHKIGDIQISLHGAKAETHDNLVGSKGAFERCNKAIEKLLDKGKKAKINTVVCKENKDELLSIMRIIESFSLEDFYVTNMREEGKAKNLSSEALDVREFWDVLKPLEKFKKEVRVHPVNIFTFLKDKGTKCPETPFSVLRNQFCKAGIVKISILPEGAVFPCENFYGLKYFYLGNILKDSFDFIWDNPKLDFFRGMKPKRECIEKNCKFTHICKGGCPAYIMFNTTNSEIDPRCPLLQKRST